jgi:biotin transport system substrate-specific component
LKLFFILDRYKENREGDKLMSVVQSAQKPFSITRTEILKVAIGVVLLFACSQIAIPVQPVPITLQTLAVLLIGLTYKPREAFATLSSYLVLGALGLPVFAAYHGGAIWLIGKTGGYLFGFLAAAVVMSFIQQSVKRRGWLQVLLTCVVGQGIIYTMGVAWLATFIGMKSGITFGLVPFVLPGLVKAGLLTAALQGIRYFDKELRD